MIAIGRSVPIEPSRSARLLTLAAGAAGLAATAFCLAFVVVSPDLRVRIVLSDDPARDGVTVVATEGVRVWGGEERETPRAGDVLRSVGGVRVRAPVDFYVACDPLFHMTANDFSPANEKPINRGSERFGMAAGGNAFVRTRDGRQFVLVRFTRPSEDAPGATPRQGYLLVRGVPTGRLWAFLLWLIPQAALTLVGGAAVWLRPHDRSARLFFLMASATVAALTGATHWWALAHTAGLLVPLAVAAPLLPGLTVHFFLAHPRPLPLLRDHGRAVRCALYLPPAAVTVAAAVGVAAAWWYARGAGPEAAAARAWALDGVGWVVDAVLGLAAAGYLLTFAALFAHWRRTGLRVERDQLRPLLAAAGLSLPVVGYVLYLAAADRAAFVHTGGRVPVLGVSLLFTVAYGVGMWRSGLLKLGEVFPGTRRYLLGRVAVTGATGVAVAAAARADRLLDVPLSPAASTLVRAAAAVFAATLAVGAADLVRRRLDRRFYREKYRLDRVLGRFGTAFGSVGEAHRAAADLATACREVLGVTRAAVYLPDGGPATASGGPHGRVAASGGKFPDRVTDDDLLPAPSGPGRGRPRRGGPAVFARSAGPAGGPGGAGGDGGDEGRAARPDRAGRSAGRVGPAGAEGGPHGPDRRRPDVPRNPHPHRRRRPAGGGRAGAGRPAAGGGAEAGRPRRGTVPPGRRPARRTGRLAGRRPARPPARRRVRPGRTAGPRAGARGRAGVGPQGGPVRRDPPAAGRERHGQGAAHPRDPRERPAAVRAAGRGALRGAVGGFAGERTVRPRAGRLHRGPTATGPGGSSRPTGGRCSSTRSATCRPPRRSSCCGLCRSGRSSGSAGTRRWRWTSA